MSKVKAMAGINACVRHGKRRSAVSRTRGFITGEIAMTMSGEDGVPERVAGEYLAVLERVGGEWNVACHMQTVEPQSSRARSFLFTSDRNTPMLL